MVNIKNTPKKSHNPTKTDKIHYSKIPIGKTAVSTQNTKNIMQNNPNRNKILNITSKYQKSDQNKSNQNA